MTLEERKQHAKEFVNARLKEAGLRATGRLCKGYQRHPRTCTIVKSLERGSVTYADHNRGGDVMLGGFTSDGKWRERWYEDPETARFMLDFDNGLYPELVVKPKPIKVAGEVIQ